MNPMPDESIDRVGHPEPYAGPNMHAEGDRIILPQVAASPTPIGSGSGGVQQAQLQPTPAMVPGPSAKDEHPEKHVEQGGARNGQWTHGLFSCFEDCGTCILSCCCPSISFAKNTHRLDYLQEHGVADPEKGGNGVNQDCLWHCCFNCCGGWGWILQFPIRKTIRERRRIEGSVVLDCLTAYFCTPCELTQESRELDAEEQATRSQMEVTPFPPQSGTRSAPTQM